MACIDSCLCGLSQNILGLVLSARFCVCVVFFMFCCTAAVESGIFHIMFRDFWFVILLSLVFSPVHPMLLPSSSATQW